MNLRTLTLALVFAGAFQISAEARAGFDLIIDESNPAAVIFSGTVGAGSAATVTPSTDPDGSASLDNFFTSSEASTSFPATGNLIENRSGLTITSGQASGTTFTLSPTGDATTYFAASAGAFENSDTFDLSSFRSQLPAAGAQGSMYAGSSFIGFWKVSEGAPLPEPSQYGAWVFLAVASFFIAKRFSRQA